MRIIIGGAALWFIYLKLEGNFNANYLRINGDNINYKFIVFTVLLMVLNWGIEAIKWRYAINKIENISISRAFKLTITGITLGMITPNRIGEIPARAMLLNKNSFKDLTLKTTVSSFSQVLITFVLGSFSLIVSTHQFDFGVSTRLTLVLLIISSLLFFLLYYGVGKLGIVFNRIKYFRDKEIFKALSEFSSTELTNLLMLSLIRYVVFSFQFWLVLNAFEVPLVSFDDILLIPICFMIASLIPTILISEIGVRGSVALFVFGTISDLDIQIILASVMLWLINVALPSIFGIFNLREFKVLKEK